MKKRRIVHVLVIAVVALVVGVAVLFALRPGNPYTSKRPDFVDQDMSAPDFEDVESSSVEILIDHEEVFPEVLKMIRGAEQEILFSMFILGGVEAPPGDPRGIGREIVDALIERMEAGVRVRVLNTAFKPRRDPRPRDQVPEDDPWLHPVFDYARKRGLPILRPAPKGGIDHTKYLVVDGREVLFGGMNLGDSVLSNHDMMVRSAGFAAREVQAVFVEAWTAAAARAEEKGRTNPAHGEPIALPVDDAQLIEARFARRQAGAQRCQIDIKITSPDRKDIRTSLLDVLATAKKGDRFKLALLLLSEDTLLDALVAAHERGVDVRVMLDPTESIFGVDCQASMNAKGIARLSDAGIPARFYDVRKGQELHLKVWVLERSSGEMLFGSGSANWTVSDMYRNWELYGIFRRCSGSAARIAEMLDTDWAEHSREIEPERIEAFRDPAHRKKLAKQCNKKLQTESWLKTTK